MPERDASAPSPAELTANDGPAADRSGTGRIAPERTADGRLADHAAIDRLAGELLPALVARLSGTGLGELEVREGDWRVRLRRPASGAPLQADRPARSARSAREGSRDAARESRPHASEPSHGQRAVHEEPGHGRRPPLVATSPAVGVFRLRGELRAGARVRAGDRLAVVDLLGVPQDVTAVGDAVIAAVFVEDGDAVEYGQALLALEPVTSPEHEAAPQAVPVG